MIKNKGFTLIEVLISLSIFIYIISAIIILFFQVSKKSSNAEKCSSFTYIFIQKMLTNEGGLDISLDNKEAYIGNQILLSENNALYLYKKDDVENFLNKKSSYQLDQCEVLFNKIATTTSPLLDNSKCLGFQYKNGSAQNIYALK